MRINFEISILSENCCINIFNNKINKKLNKKYIEMNLFSLPEIDKWNSAN